MARSSRAGALLAAGCWVVLAPKLGGCIAGLELEQRPCPCLEGYECCHSLDRCLGPDEECPDESKPGGLAGSPPVLAEGGGPSGGMAATSAGDGPGEAGTPAEPAGGAGGAPGPSDPHWSPLGEAGGVAPPATYDPMLALGPDGTAYLAYRACDPCQPLEDRTDVPVVIELSPKWRRLPATGLGETVKSSPALVIAQDGAPQLLTDYDGRVLRFNGEEWTQFAPTLPLKVQQPVQLEQDSAGKLYTVLFDDVNITLHVARLDDPSTWTLLGPGLSADNGSLRLCVAGAEVYRAHVRDQGPDATFSFVERLEGSSWQEWGSFEGRSIELAATPEGDVFAAVMDYELRTASIQHRHAGTWQPLPELTASWRAPQLQVSSSGVLYAAYLVEDFVNVNRFDGHAWQDLKSSELGNGSGIPLLRVVETGGAEWPIVGFLSGGGLRARKYQ